MKPFNKSPGCGACCYLASEVCFGEVEEFGVLGFWGLGSYNFSFVKGGDEKRLPGRTVFSQRSLPMCNPVLENNPNPKP